MSFGKLITIERQLTGQDYFCRDAMTGELSRVHVLPEFADEIEEEFGESDRGGPQGAPKGCIFLRKDPGGRGYTCAVYPTRPAICRNFTCYRMLIYHQSGGDVRGKVIGSRELRTDDAALQTLWDTEIASLPLPSPKSHGGSSDSGGRGSRVNAGITGTASADDREWVGKVQTILATHGYRGEPVE
jgi:uncharacterized protein